MTKQYITKASHMIQPCLTSNSCSSGTSDSSTHHNSETSQRWYHGNISECLSAKTNIKKESDEAQRAQESSGRSSLICRGNCRLSTLAFQPPINVSWSDRVWFIHSNWVPFTPLDVFSLGLSSDITQPDIRLFIIE